MIEVKTTIYCDRCGKKIEESECAYTVHFCIKPEKIFNTKPKDLCFDCAKSFNEWMVQGIRKRDEII